MAVTFQQQIAALYSGIFNRAPDKQGLEFWVAQMEGGLSLSAIADGFTNHPVFTETYSGMTNEQMVRALYTNMLGSAGDEAGIQFWVAKLDAGASFGQVVSEFISGALTIDLDALLQSGELSLDDYNAAVARQATITNKVDAGLYFVEKFGDASNLSAGTDAGTKAGLESDPVYLASQAAIAKVTADASSVVAAKEAIDNSPAPRDLLVVVSGEAIQGGTLVASNSLGSQLADISYQWLRDGVAIDGANNDSYVLTQDDVGAQISVVANYTDGQGEPQTVSSVATSAVQNVDDEATGELNVTGTAEQGGTLTADLANLIDADGEASVAYQWQVQIDGEWVDIDGENAAELSIAADQSAVGQTVRVVATSTDSLGGTTVFTGETLLVDNVNDAPTGAVTISGEATEGETLTASNTLADEDGLGEISYQWLRDGVAIDGATGSDYVLTQADVGAEISVSASYTDAQGAAESVSSAATAAVANVNDAPTGAVTISGEATEGETLTASNTLADEDGLGEISYQWLRDGVAIDGAVGTEYVLTQADVGAAISVSASYTDSLGAAESVSSDATAAVANVDDEATGTLSVTGTAEQGSTLTAALADVVDADGEPTTAYQWQVQVEGEWTAIDGATAAEFAIADDQTLVGQNIRVVATTTDALGGTTVFEGESQTVANVNDAPTLQNALVDQSATQGQAFSFTVPANTFADIDGDILSYSAALVDADGDLVGDGSLPAWLTFDPATGTFSGTPADGDVGVVNVRVTATDGSESVSDIFALTQIDATAPVAATVTLATIDDTGLVGDLITNKTAVTLNVGGIENGGRAWLDKDGNGTYDAGVDQLAVDGAISISGLVIGGNSYRIINADAAGNTTSTNINVVRDTAAPNRDVETPISTNSAADGAYNAGETITVMFGELVNVQTLLSGAITVANSHSLGDGATFVAANADANGYATTFTLTLGANSTLAAGDTISFASNDVVDIAGNKALGAVAFTLPGIPDATAPVFTSDATAAADERQNVLYTAQATDAAGAVTYSLAAGNEDDAALLSIDPTTGAVTLTAGNLDFATKDSYSFTVVATDAANNPSSQAVTVQVNNLAPLAPTVALTTDTGVEQDGLTSNAAISVTEAETGGTLQYRVTQGDVVGEWTNEYTTPEADGTYTVEVIHTDAFGQASEAGSVTFTLDTTGPAVAAEGAITAGEGATAVEGTYTAGSTFTLNFAEPVRVTDIVNSLQANGALGSPQVTVGEVEDDYASSFTVILGIGSTLAEGDTITIAKDAVVDRAGNAASADVEFTAPDVTAPTIASASISDGGVTTSLDGSIELTFDEAISTEESDFDSVWLTDADGKPVAVTVTVNGTVVSVTPVAPLTLAAGYKLSWAEGAFADAAGNAVAASVGSIGFTAAGDFTGTVEQVNALTNEQLEAAGTITVQDSAEAISAADFSAGNLSYVRSDLARTITINADDLAEERFIVVQVGELAPIEMWMSASTTTEELATAVANALKERDPAFNDTAVVVGTDGDNATITLDASLDLGATEIGVSFAPSVFDLQRYPIEATTYQEGGEAVVRITELDALESADRFVQVLGLHPTSSTYSFSANVYPGMTALEVAQGIVADMYDFDDDTQPYDPLTGEGNKFRADTVSLRETPEGIEIVLTGDALDRIPYFNQVTVQYGQYNPGAAIGNTASSVTPASTPVITQVVLADGETGNAYLSVSDLEGRTFDLDNTGEGVTGQFVVRDDVAALAAVTDELAGVQGIDSYEVVDALDALFNGDQLSAALTTVLANHRIDRLTVTDGALNLAQAEVLAEATATEAAGGTATLLTYDLTDSAANLLEATEEQLVLIGGAADVDVSNTDVGAVTYEQLQGLYALTDLDGEHDQGAFTYTLTATVAQLFDGDVLKADAVTADYLSNASTLTVTGGLNLAQAAALNSYISGNGEDDLAAVVYDLSLTTAQLLAAYGTDNDHPQRALLNGARDITVTDGMSVEQASYFGNINNTGSNNYNIVDTAQNLAGGNSTIIQDAFDLTATSVATASQATAIYANRGVEGGLFYDVRDSAANLAGANAAAMNAAGNISSWNTASAGEAQTIVNFTNSGYTQFESAIRDSVAALNTFIDRNGAGVEDDTDGLRPYTYQVRDNAANISAAAADAVDAQNPLKDDASKTTQHVLLNAEYITVTDYANYTQASTLVNNLHESAPSLLTDGKVSFSISDSVANLTNDRIWLNGDTELNDTNRATSFVDNLYVNDTAANIAAAQNGDGVIDGTDREVFQRIDQVGGGITASGSDGSQTIAGSSSGDSLDGGNGDDVLYGNGGWDTLVGGNGNDTLFGGDGRDTIYAGTGAGTGSGSNYSGISNWVYGGEGGDNLFGSGTTGNHDRDQFTYVGSTREELIAESGTFTRTRDYINDMGYGDSIEFSSVDNGNIFFQGTTNNVANSVEAGTLALAISYDRNVQVSNWNDSGLVTGTKVNIDIANAAGQFDGVADMSIIIVGSNMDINWDGNSLVYGA